MSTSESTSRKLIRNADEGGSSKASTSQGEDTSESYDGFGDSDIYRKGLCVGTKIEAKDFDNKWYAAKVIDVDFTERELLIHFEKWNSKFDEWIPMDSSRLRSIEPPMSEKEVVKFSKGESVMALWSPYQKYPGTVQAVLSNDRYDILFYDGFTKRMKGSKIFKMEEGQTTVSEIKKFTDIGTKEERRARKKRLNVAELFHINKRRKALKKSEQMRTYPVNRQVHKISSKKPDEEATTVVTSPIITPSVTTAVMTPSTPTSVVDSKPEAIVTYNEQAGGGSRSLVNVIPAALQVTYMDGRVEMWNKQMYRRSEGRTAGKMDIVITNQQGRKFRSRNEIMKYCEDNNIIYSHDAFDFSVKGRPKNKSILQTDMPGAVKPVPETTTTTTDLKKPVKKKETEAVQIPPVEIQQPQVTSVPGVVAPVNADVSAEGGTRIFIGDVEVKIEDGQLKCPGTGCNKHFRRENLLHMHMKHYHPEYSKYLDYTPSVTDLAYARTVGSLETVEAAASAPRKSLNVVAGEKEKSVSKGDTDKVGRKSTAAAAIVGSPGDTVKETKKTISKGNIELKNETKPASKGKISSVKTPTKPLPTTISPLDVPGHFRDETTSQVQSAPPVLENFQMFRNNNISQDAIPSAAFFNSGEDQQAVENIPKMQTDAETGCHNDHAACSHYRNIRRQKRNTCYMHGSSFIEQLKRRRMLDYESIPRPLKMNKMGRQQRKPIPPSQISGDELSNSTTSSQPFQVSSQLKPTSLAEKLCVSTELSDLTEGTEDSKSPLVAEAEKYEKLRRNEIINCLCGMSEEDGLMIQCDLCLCWQHGHCLNIYQDSEVPERYICSICKDPYRGRKSMKYLNDQAWLKDGVLPSLSFRSKRPDVINQRTAMLKRSHDLSGSLSQLDQVIHSLRVKANIAEQKDHPKLWLWAKKWNEKKSKGELDFIKEEKIDTFETSAEKPQGNQQRPKAPEPEAPIDPVDCRLNLLDHIIHYQTLVDARLSSIESQIAELESMQEDAADDETPDNYPRCKATVQMLLRDLEIMKEVADAMS